MKLTLLVIPAVILITGCTSVQVSKLSASHSIDRVAIKENSSVTVPNFLNIVQNEFENHGLTTVIYQDQVPTNCQATLTYTALRSWDLASYLSHAELTIRDLNGKRIAYAIYHLKGKGGLDLTKWGSVQSKMKPVIDELLKEYK